MNFTGVNTRIFQNIFEIRIPDSHRSETFIFGLFLKFFIMTKTFYDTKIFGICDHAGA